MFVRGAAQIVMAGAVYHTVEELQRLSVVGPFLQQHEELSEVISEVPLAIDIGHQLRLFQFEKRRV